MRASTDQFGFLILFVAVFTGFLCFNYAFGFYLFPMLLPEMKAGLDLDYRTVGAMTAAAQLAYLASSLGAGFIVARIGGVTVVVVSTVVCGMALIVVGLLSATWFLATMLAVLGAMAASVWVPMVVIVSRTIPPRHRGAILGIFSSAGAFGAMLNGLAVPWLLARSDWRHVWIAAGALVLATVAAAVPVLRRLGTLGRRETGDESAPASPPRKSISRRPILLIWATIGIAAAVCYAFQTYLAAHLHEDFGYGPDMSARLWMGIGLAGMIGGGLMGMLADRAGIKSALGLAAALLAIGALLLSKNAGPLPLLSGSVAYGLSYYAIFGLVPAYIAKILPAERTAPVFGIANVCAGVGGALGNFAGGWSQALTGGLGPVYAGCAVGATLLFVPIMLLPSERRDRAES